MNIDNFIYTHFKVKDYKNYCEATITPELDINYSVPSHLEYLISYAIGKDFIDRETLKSQIPIYASPIEWLCDKYGCVSLWFDFAVASHTISDSQYSMIQSLIDAKVLSSEYRIKITDEYLRTSVYDPISCPDFRKEIVLRRSYGN